MNYDLVIRNAMIYDGTGAAARSGSVAISDGKIAAVDHSSLHGKREVDAGGLALAPGFIDIHTHFDAQISWDPLFTPSCWHGVTTVLMGNCGVGVAPCRTSERPVMAWDLVNVEAMSYDLLLNGVAWEWESFPEYVAAIKRHGIALNVAMMEPLSALRFYVMGEASTQRAATADEIETMTRLLREAIAAGGYGFSLSLARQHIGYQGRPLSSRLASREELGALARTVRNGGRGIIQLNLPRDQQGLLTDESYQTLAYVAGECQRPVTWTPFAYVAGSPDDLLERLAARIEPAVRSGLQIRTQSACRPTKIFITLREPFMFAAYPCWKAAFNRSREEQLALYRSAEFRKTFKDETQRGLGVIFRGEWERVEVGRVSNEKNRAFLNRTVPEMATALGKDPIDAMLDLAIDENLEAGFRFLGGNSDARLMSKVVQAPHVLVGLSDAGAHIDQLCNAGVPTYMLQEWVRNRGVLSLEQAVRRLTSEPAEFFGFRSKGRIAPGMDGDLVLFDPQRVKLCPQEWINDLPGGRPRIIERSEGFAYTIIGGEIVFDHNQYLGTRSGQVL
jgi:N-acyl-D-aspartate/D-glutamate deacylase